MSPRGPSITSVFSHVAELLLVYSIFCWSIFAPGAAFDWTGVIATVRMLGCALILSLVGRAVMVTSRRWLQRTSTPTRDGPSTTLPPLSSAVLALALGQIAAMGWVSARSAVSGFSYYLTGKQLSISLVEVLALLGGATYLNWIHRSPHTPHQHATRLLGFVGVLLCAVAPVAFRELPRTVALSSDPDQHAFWASQVYSLGIVPWDQGLTGVGPFGYPAGFAALNAVWMLFSGLSATEIVTIQPELQFLLAVMTCAVMAPVLYRSPSHDSTPGDQQEINQRVALVTLCSFAIYWFILPYGLQSERWHGEGTARLSTSLLSAIVVLSWLLPNSPRHANRNNPGSLLVAIVAVCLIATVNPLSALIPLCLLACVAFRYLYRGISLRRLRETVLFASIAFVLACFILGGEPYLVTAVTKLTSSVQSSQATASSLSLPSATFNFDSLAVLVSARTLVPHLLAGTLLNDPPLEMMAILSLAVGVWTYRAPGITLRWLSVVWLCGAVAFGARGLQSTSANDLPLYLVAPYAHEAALQTGAILGYTLAIVTVFWALSLRRRGFGLGLVFCLALWFSTQRQSISGASTSFNVRPRRCSSDTPHCLSQSERNALTYVEQLGLRIRSQYPGLTYASAPKIMILGTPKRFARERWVFPSGASRVVPLFSSIPVAFFYGRGNNDWSFENYTSKICKRLDVAWLKQRNVRYLFLGKRDPGCMKRRKDVVKRSTILFDDAGTRVVQLF
jgi:hypothetical protein